MRTVVKACLSLVLILALAFTAYAQSSCKAKRKRLHRPYISRAITGAVDQPIPRPRGMEEARATYSESGAHEYATSAPTPKEIRREMRRTRREQRRAARIAAYLDDRKSLSEQVYLGEQLAQHHPSEALGVGR